MFQLRPSRRLRRSLYAQVQDETRAHTSAAAMVFAPHQDDETLGCGGTIILKRQASTPVRCVFMTDGTTSHQQFMGKDELAYLRRQEALEAAAVLGLAADHVHFLGHPDGELSRHHRHAVVEVIGLLNQYRPAEIFVPYQADGTPDHEATYQIVAEAVRTAGFPLRVCEYPVWFWNHWPWVSLPLKANRDCVRDMRRALAAGLGHQAFREFQSGVRVGDVLTCKRQALDKHRSQMTPLMSGVAWPTLQNVAGGEFLNCFFQEFEIFRCREADTGNAAERDRGLRQSAVACN